MPLAQKPIQKARATTSRRSFRTVHFESSACGAARGVDFRRWTWHESAMQRKLTAILSADVVGYSGMMETDEAGTLERLKRNRSSVFDPAVATHEGRQFKLLGDGALVEFASVVAAVNCALAIQENTSKAEPDV